MSRRAIALACALAFCALGGTAHARLGDLDPAFGGGAALPELGAGASRFETVAPRSDGGIVAAGVAGGDGVIVRLSSGGAVEGVTRFPAEQLFDVAIDGDRVLVAGVNGQQEPLVRLGATLVLLGASGEARAVLALPGGMTLVAGRRSQTAAFVTRLNATGQPDQGFGDGGTAQPFAGTVHALAVDAVGRIVLAAESGGQPVLARLDATGNLDLTFGTRGVLPVADEPGALRAVRIDGPGRIVAAGDAGGGARVVRVTNGAVDPGFGPLGVSGRLEGLALDGDRSLLAGTTGTQLLLGALDGGGAVDTAFGGGLRALSILPGQPAEGLAAAPGPSGTMYVAGATGTRAFVARTLPNAAPTAALSAPAQAFTGTPVTFGAGDASDPEGEPLRFAFDLDGNGTFEHDAGGSPTAAVSFAAAGQHAVGVRVSDPRGATAVATRSILAIAPEPPQARAQPQPRPALGKQGVARPLRGTVRIRLPGTKRFIRLADLAAIPDGSEIDARKGRVLITVVRNARGKLDSAQFYAGRFIFRQANGRRPITTLKLSGGSFGRCRARRGNTLSATASAAVAWRAGPAVSAAVRGRKKKRVRRLWGDGRGRFRTRGRYGAATVRGTKWHTADRCDGTAVRVVRGKVAVAGGTESLRRDRRATIVKAGQRKLVRARR